MKAPLVLNLDQIGMKDISLVVKCSATSHLVESLHRCDRKIKNKKADINNLKMLQVPYLNGTMLLVAQGLFLLTLFFYLTLSKRE